MVKDVLIVGQGLAGSVLALELHQRKCSFDIIDNCHSKSASLSAGGITHPMSFKRLIESWKGREFLIYAKDFYERRQDELNTIFWYNYKLLRPYDSLEDQNNWMAKMKHKELEDILSDSKKLIPSILHPFGLGEVSFSGRLDIQTMMRSVSVQFAKLISKERFHHDLVKFDSNSVTYKNKIYKKIIFCEGFQFIDNPYFSYLPSNVTKGELIEIIAPDLQLNNEMISKGCFIAPTGIENRFVVGSTYEWNNTDISTTQKGKQELIEKINKIGLTNYQVVDHRCGIRPTTHDRKPLIGFHPKYQQLGIFTGMGSKTVMLAPLLAAQLTNEINGGTSIFTEANITRVEKKHFHKFLDYERAKMS